LYWLVVVAGEASIHGGCVGGFRLVEVKYPALLFKQQLDALVQTLYPLMCDNIKKSIMPLLVSCQVLGVFDCYLPASSGLLLTGKYTACCQVVACVTNDGWHVGVAGRDQLVPTVLLHRVSAFTPRMAHTTGAGQ
jgi:hypothetical protein